MSERDIYIIFGFLVIFDLVSMYLSYRLRGIIKKRNESIQALFVEIERAHKTNSDQEIMIDEYSQRCKSWQASCETQKEMIEFFRSKLDIYARIIDPESTPNTSMKLWDNHQAAKEIIKDFLKDNSN